MTHSMELFSNNYGTMLVQSAVMRLHVVHLSVRNDQVPCSNTLEVFENNFTAE